LFASAQDVAASITPTVPDASAFTAGRNKTNGRSKEVSLSNTESEVPL
jgi:hypothetical protein